MDYRLLAHREPFLRARLTLLEQDEPKKGRLQVPLSLVGRRSIEVDEVERVRERRVWEAQPHSHVVVVVGSETFLGLKAEVASSTAEYALLLLDKVIEQWRWPLLTGFSSCCIFPGTVLSVFRPFHTKFLMTHNLIVEMNSKAGADCAVQAALYARFVWANSNKATDTDQGSGLAQHDEAEAPQVV